MTAQVLAGLSHQDYHADRLPGSPRFSRSCAWALLTKSPLHAWDEHPRGGGAERKGTEDTDRGDICHSLVLGEGSALVVVKIHQDKAKIGPLVEADSFRTDEAKAACKRARAAGQIPVLAKQLEKYQGVAASIPARLAAFGVPRDADRELTVLWDEPLPDGRKVACKARLDLSKHAHIWDLKFPSKGTPASFRRSLPWNGGALQSWVYKRALGLVYPELAGRVELSFLWAESIRPFDVAEIKASRTQESLAEMQWRRACRAWADGLETGVWPGYGSLALEECPPYLLENELAAAYAANATPEWAEGA